MNNFQKRLVAWTLMFVMIISSSVAVTASETPLYDNDTEYDLTYDYYSGTEYESDIIFVDDLVNDPEFVADLRAELAAEFGAEFMVNQDRAGAMIDAFMNVLPVRRDGTVIYPENYGGMYVDSYGNLVILIAKERSNGNQEQIGSITPDRNSGIPECAAMLVAEFTYVSVRYVEFTYEEIMRVWQVIYDYMAMHGYRPDEYVIVECPVILNLNAIEMDIIENRVNVYLYNTREHYIDLFRSIVIDHPAVNFLYAVHVYVEYSPYMGEKNEYFGFQPFIFAMRQGQQIYRRCPNNANNVRWQSVGFRARCRTTRNLGFVSTMHGNATVRTLRAGDRIYRATPLTQANLAATVTRVSIGTDASFMTLSNNASMLNTAVNGTIVGTTIHSNPIVGQVVTRISDGGSPTSPRASAGTIVSLNYIRNVPSVGNVLTHRSSYVAFSGDSGGIVVRLVAGANAQVSGIHIARTFQQNSEHGLFAPTQRVLTGLNIELH